MAAHAGDTRVLPAAGGGAAGLWHLLSAAVSQPDPAQDPNRGRRQRPERTQPQHRADPGRQQRGERGLASRHDRRRARAALDRGDAFAVVGIPPGTERDVLKGTTVHVPIYADATYLFIFRSMGSGIGVAIDTLSSELAAGGARTDGSLVKAALASTSPAEVLLQPIFNPVGGYASYVVPTAFVLILQQLVLTAASMLAVVALAQPGGGAGATVPGRGVAQ